MLDLVYANRRAKTWTDNPMVQTVLDMVAEDASIFIAGGFVRAMENDQPAADVDVFGLTQESVLRAAWAYAKRILLEYPDSLRVVMTKCAVTFFLDPVSTDALTARHLPVQFIYKWTGTPESVIEEFDFTCIQAAYLDDTALVRTKDFVDDNKSNTLKIANLKQNPYSTLRRVIKYKGYGYDLASGELDKLVWNLIETTVGKTTIERDATGWHGVGGISLFAAFEQMKTNYDG